MCQYQTLYHNDKTGYVIRCTDCEKIQLAYSNLVMTFSHEDFDAFRFWIKKIRDEQPEGKNPAIRSIMIPAPCQGIQLLLSPRELDDLVAMLETADTELQSVQLISLFHP
ncbi:MAG TPA: DUF6686 family protein [Chitinophagaceae bacterium]